jgi:glutaredoxin
MTKLILLFMLLLIFFCTTAEADFYQWEDKNGNVQITDYPPPAKSGKKVQVYDYDSNMQGGQETSKDGPKKEPDVVLYTKDSCTDCDKAREFLKSKNITFTEYNTDKDKEAAKKRKSIDDSEDVPFAIIKRNQVYGFSEGIYNRLLKTNP